jgi:hypothetical protein
MSWHWAAKILAIRIGFKCGQPMVSYTKTQAWVKRKEKKKQFDQGKT